MTSSRPTFVYVTYIAASPERVWEALTRPDMSEKYWFGYRVTADGKPGERMTAVNPAGRLAHDDPIVESDPPRRLVIRWRNEFRPELKAEGYSRCTMQIELADYYPDFGGKAVKLTIRHELEGEGGKFIEAVSGGWPKVISNLKSLLETGDVAFKE